MKFGGFGEKRIERSHFFIDILNSWSYKGASSFKGSYFYEK
jgi:hypothetical protein